MARRFHPTERWEIDWNGDGSYNHPASNITSHWLSHQLLFGSNTALDGRAVSIGTTTGTITLRNHDYRYDPDSPHAAVNETDLRSRRDCRLRMGSRIDWRGKASFGRKVGHGTSSTITINLHGSKSAELTKSKRELVYDGGTVAGVMARFSDTFGVPISGGTAEPIGLVHFEESGIYFLDNIGRYAGGWCLEDQEGNWSFTRWNDTTSRSPEVALTLAHGPDADTISVAEREGFVRNEAECNAFSWVTSTDEALIASAEFSVDRFEEVSTILRFKQSSYRQPLGWTRFEATPEDLVILRFGAAINNFSARADARTRGYAAAQPQKIRIAGYGTVRSRVKVTPFELDNNEHDTQQVFGKRRLRLPPWFPSTFTNVSRWTRPWLRNLSQPPVLIGITYPDLQATESMSRDLARAVSGTVVSVQFTDDNRVVTKKILVLSVYLTGGPRAAPLRRIIGVETRDVPPPPLTASTRAVTDRTAEVQANVQSPAREQVYMRIRTA